MLFALALSAIIRVGGGGEVVDEVERTNTGGRHPCPEALIVEASVSEVEINPAASRAAASKSVAESARDERTSKVAAGLCKKIEQCGRRLSIEDAAQSAMLHHGLRLFTEVLEV